MPNLVTNNFKQALFEGWLEATGATFKVALFKSTLNPTTAYSTYSAANEATGGNYVAGGVTLTNDSVTADGDHQRFTYTNPSWVNLGTGSPVTYRYVVLYRSDLSTNNVVMIWDLGADRTVSGATETLEFGTGVNAPLSI